MTFEIDDSVRSEPFFGLTRRIPNEIVLLAFGVQVEPGSTTMVRPLLSARSTIRAQATIRSAAIGTLIPR